MFIIILTSFCCGLVVCVGPVLFSHYYKRNACQLFENCRIHRKIFSRNTGGCWKNAAKMAKFCEIRQFLRERAVENARKSVRKWRKNAIRWPQARRVFQKVTVNVSRVKRLVRQNEMGLCCRRS